MNVRSVLACCNDPVQSQLFLLLLCRKVVSAPTKAFIALTCCSCNLLKLFIKCDLSLLWSYRPVKDSIVLHHLPALFVLSSLSTKYLIFASHFSATLFVSNLLLSSCAISSQTFMASLLSRQSNQSPQRLTRYFCSYWLHLSYCFGFFVSCSVEMEFETGGLTLPLHVRSGGL